MYTFSTFRGKVVAFSIFLFYHGGNDHPLFIAGGRTPKLLEEIDQVFEQQFCEGVSYVLPGPLTIETGELYVGLTRFGRVPEVKGKRTSLSSFAEEPRADKNCDCYMHG